MITIEELNAHKFPTTPEIDANLKKLLQAINIIRVSWNHPMTITSGLRSIEDHKRIYREKGIPDNKIPMGSRHLIGAAVDIFDPNSLLHDWCKANENELIRAGLWCEERQGNWQHFQIFAPASGKRWFSP